MKINIITMGCKACIEVKIKFAPVAQLDRAPATERIMTFLKFMDKLKNFPLVFHLTTISPQIVTTI